MSYFWMKGGKREWKPEGSQVGFDLGGSELRGMLFRALFERNSLGKFHSIYLSKPSSASLGIETTFPELIYFPLVFSPELLSFLPVLR